MHESYPAAASAQTQRVFSFNAAWTLECRGFLVKPYSALSCIGFTVGGGAEEAWLDHLNWAENPDALHLGAPEKCISGCSHSEAEGLFIQCSSTIGMPVSQLKHRHPTDVLCSLRIIHAPYPALTDGLFCSVKL